MRVRDLAEGPKDFPDMGMDLSKRAEELNYYYKDHGPTTFGEPKKIGKFQGHDIIQFSDSETLLIFLVDGKDMPVFYAGLSKHKDSYAVENVRSTGQVKATEFYRYLINQYKKLYSGDHQTPQGRKIWQNLSRTYPELEITDVGDRLMATQQTDILA